MQDWDPNEWQGRSQQQIEGSNQSMRILVRAALAAFVLIGTVKATVFLARLFFN